MYEIPSDSELQKLYPNSELDWKTLREYHYALPIAEAMYSRWENTSGNNNRQPRDVWVRHLASMFIHYQRILEKIRNEPNK